MAKCADGGGFRGRWQAEMAAVLVGGPVALPADPQ